MARRPKIPELGQSIAVPQHLLTPRQLAHRFQISVSTIARHLRSGLPHERIGGQIRFDYDAVLQYYRKRS